MVTKIGLAKGVVHISLRRGSIGTVKKVESDRIQIGGEQQEIGKKPTEGKGDKSRVHANKEYVDKASLSDIDKLDREIDKFVKQRTLPGVFGLGERAVPEDRFGYVDERVLKYIDERNAAAEIWMTNYPQVIAKAQADLGPLGLFDPEDYLSETDARRRFYVSYTPFTIDVPDNVPQEVFAREKAKAQEAWDDAARTWQKHMRLQVLQMAQHMADRLAPDSEGKKKRFVAGSMVENFKTLLAEFPFMNVTSDAQLVEAVKKLEEHTTEMTVENLEDSEEVRKALSLVASGVVDAVAPLVQEFEREVD